MYNVLRYASAITPLLKPSLNENEKLLQFIGVYGVTKHNGIEIEGYTCYIGNTKHLLISGHLLLLITTMQVEAYLCGFLARQ